MNRLFRRLLPKPVANNGSQLRDHQANERTFLSWTRMGLAFAAMSLALARLDFIDNVLRRKFRDEEVAAPKQPLQIGLMGNLPIGARIPVTEKVPEKTPILLSHANDQLASRVCQAISIWSFGYSFARYISVRRNLLLGRFVPAIWGPFLITCGSLGVFTLTLKL
ncbi:hypothetical protein N7475_004752 [Penicillium sp. IBT 31633x]|nr:hypothetical protein N7475_004752 [Penicillium sp. IBT 31633x]